MDPSDLDAQLEFFRFPLDDDVRLWRYMGMKWFVEMLQTGTSYFRRLDCLEDQFEAVLTPIGVDRWIEELTPEAVRRYGITDGVDPYEQGFHAVGSATFLLRASSFVNCWHQNEYESSAMWNLFATRLGSRTGIAVRSTVGRLRDGLKRTIPIGDVKYIDHENDEADWKRIWLYKNHMYSWEKEVRAYTVHWPCEWSIAEFNPDHPTGLYISVDLDELIETVVLAPGTDESTYEKTLELLALYGLGHKVIAYSAADRLPEYVVYSAANRQTVIDNGLVAPIHSSTRGKASGDGSRKSRKK